MSENPTRHSTSLTPTAWFSFRKETSPWALAAKTSPRPTSTSRKRFPCRPSSWTRPKSPTTSTANLCIGSETPLQESCLPTTSPTSMPSPRANLAKCMTRLGSTGRKSWIGTARNRMCAKHSSLCSCPSTSAISAERKSTQENFTIPIIGSTWWPPRRKTLLTANSSKTTIR